MQQEIQKTKLIEDREGVHIQREDPMVAKALVWAIAVLAHRTKRTC